MNMRTPATAAAITSSGTITPAAIAPALLSSSSSVMPVDATARKSSASINGPGCPCDSKGKNIILDIQKHSIPKYILF